MKEQVLQAIQRLPDAIDFRDVTHQIAPLAAVHEPEQPIQEERLVSNEQGISSGATFVQSELALCLPISWDEGTMEEARTNRGTASRA